MARELPKIISVDDHIVEPPHLWQTWLPQRFRAAGPHVERRGIGTMKHIGGGADTGRFRLQGTAQSVKGQVMFLAIDDRFDKSWQT